MDVLDYLYRDIHQGKVALRAQSRSKLPRLATGSFE